MLESLPVQMEPRQPYQLEVAGESAALYVNGTLDDESVRSMLDVCGALPVSIRTLRLDLRGLGAMSACTTDAVRRVLRQWRDSRHGEFRLSTAHLIATCSETAA
jgi:hypothetical protein